jgi:aarF domain-containing kinase
MRSSVTRLVVPVGQCLQCGLAQYGSPILRSGGRQAWQSKPNVLSQSSYSTASLQPKKTGRRIILLAAAGAGALAGTLAFTDDLKHGYGVAQRSGRVASTLAICTNDYRKTLKRREQIEDSEEKARLLSECHTRCAKRTLKTLEKNGGVFIKLGQHISALGYLLPPEWTTTFVPLQDKCPVSSYESIDAMFETDTGYKLLEYFSDFSPVPIGAASLAQVHLATIKESGQKVAVKVQHPSLKEWAPLDLTLTRITFAALKRFFPDYDLSWLSQEMDYSLPKELNFELEAANAIRTKQHFSHRSDIPLVVPDVIWAKRRILVMANEAGHRLDDLEYLDANHIDRDEVAATLAHIFNEMIFGDGAPLHCDPHGGNLAIRPTRSHRLGRKNFEIILYDHGLYRDIPLELRRSYAKMWLAIIDGSVPRMKKYAHEVAGIDEDKFPLFAAAITGRDAKVVTSSMILTPRSEDEKEELGAEAIKVLPELVGLLGQVPRVVLLILKTNDLTRALDESLHTRQGPMRQFLILARYCSKTVFLEQWQNVRKAGSVLWPPNAFRLLAAWLGFMRVELKLELFEICQNASRTMGFKQLQAAGPRK